MPNGYGQIEENNTISFALYENGVVFLSAFSHRGCLVEEISVLYYIQTS